MNKKTLIITILSTLIIVLAFFVYNNKAEVDIDSKSAGGQVIEGDNLIIDKKHKEEIDKEAEDEVNESEPGDNIKDIDKTANVGNNKAGGENKQSTSQDPSDKPVINEELENLKKKVEDSAVEIKEDIGEPANKMYEKIFNNYNAKLKSSSTKFISELANEEKVNTNGLEGLSNIANKKLSSLLDIQIEGFETMKKVLEEKGIHGQHTEYQRWVEKLSETHSKEVEKILVKFGSLAEKYK